MSGRLFIYQRTTGHVQVSRMKKSSELLINQSTVGKALGALNCKPIKPGDVFAAADSLVEEIVDKACLNAKANGRRTVMPSDIRPFITRSIPMNDKEAMKELKKGKGKKVLGNHVYDARVKEFMNTSLECNGGTRMRMSGKSSIFLDASIEDMAIKACKIGNGTIDAKTLDNLV